MAMLNNQSVYIEHPPKKMPKGDSTDLRRAPTAWTARRETPFRRRPGPLWLVLLGSKADLWIDLP